MENINELTNCPQCDNACPRDQLKCGRGRAFFGVESEGTAREEHNHHHHDHGDHDHTGHSHHHHKSKND